MLNDLGGGMKQSGTANKTVIALRWAFIFILGLLIGWFGSLVATLSLVAGAVAYALVIWFWKPALRRTILPWAVTIILGTIPGVAMHIYKSHEATLAQQTAYQNRWIKQATVAPPTMPSYAYPVY